MTHVGRSSEGPPYVAIYSPTTAFGELKVAAMKAIAQVDAVHGLRTTDVTSTTDNGGSTSATGSLFSVKTGTTNGGRAFLHTRRVIKYRGGQGTVARISAIFDTPVDDTIQLAAFVSRENALAFGYLGTSFGVLRRTGGLVEIQTLTVGTGAGGSESATVTLDGDDTVVPLTAGNTTHAANELAAATYAGWTASALGATVVFLSQTTGNRTGSFSLASDGTAAGTFAETRAGVADTDAWEAQADWNIDNMLGVVIVNNPTPDNPTKQKLNPQKLNVYEAQFQWLGGGPILFLIEQTHTGLLVPVHRVPYANENTAPSLLNPTMHVGWLAESTGGTTDVEVKGSCAAGFVEGEPSRFRLPRGTKNTKAGVTTAATNILTIRNGSVFAGSVNFNELLLAFVNVAVDGNKPASASLILNATLGGTPDWAKLDATNSTVEIDTAGTTVTGGQEVLPLSLGKSDSQLVDLSKLEIALKHDDTLTVAVNANGVGQTTDATVSLSWHED